MNHCAEYGTHEHKYCNAHQKHRWKHFLYIIYHFYYTRVLNYFKNVKILTEEPTPLPHNTFILYITAVLFTISEGEKKYKFFFVFRFSKKILFY